MSMIVLCNGIVIVIVKYECKKTRA